MSDISHTALYSTDSNNNVGSSINPKLTPVKYANADTHKLQIITENRGKAGVYR